MDRSGSHSTVSRGYVGPVDYILADPGTGSLRIGCGRSSQEVGNYLSLVLMWSLQDVGGFHPERCDAYEEHDKNISDDFMGR